MANFTRQEILAMMGAAGTTPGGGAVGGAAPGGHDPDPATVWDRMVARLQLFGFGGPPPPPWHPEGPRTAFQLFFTDPKVQATIRLVFGDLLHVQRVATAWWIYRDLPQDNRWALRAEVLEAEFQDELWNLNQKYIKMR